MEMNPYPWTAKQTLNLPHRAGLVWSNQARVGSHLPQHDRGSYTAVHGAMNECLLFHFSS